MVATLNLWHANFIVVDVRQWPSKESQPMDRYLVEISLPTYNSKDMYSFEMFVNLARPWKWNDYRPLMNWGSSGVHDEFIHLS